MPHTLKHQKDHDEDHNHREHDDATQRRKVSPDFFQLRRPPMSADLLHNVFIKAHSIAFTNFAEQLDEAVCPDSDKRDRCEHEIIMKAEPSNEADHNCASYPAIAGGGHSTMHLQVCRMLLLQDESR